MKQNCYIVQDLMCNYAEGLVSEQTAQDVAEHLEECAPCRTVYESMTAPLPKNVIIGSDTERADNMKKVNYLKKFRRVLLILLIALAVMTIVTAWFYVLYVAFLPGDQNRTEFTDITAYEQALGAEGEFKQNYIGRNDIFPDELPQTAQTESFYSACLDAFDRCYVSYLVYTCSDEDFAAERSRLKALKSSEDYSVYGTEGFRYELCAVYADEYHGIIYALADAEDNRLIYVSLEFCNFICDIEYDQIIDADHLPIGFDAAEGNATRREFDETGILPGEEQ